MEQSNNMPSKGLYKFFLIAGFFLGIIWGFLSLKPYKNMKLAIENGEEDEAWAYAKKIRIFFIIAVVVNTLALIGNLAGG